MFKNNIEIMCSSKLSKSLLNPEKVQGSTIKPSIKSGVFPSLPLDSTYLSPDPSTLTQLPGDARHRSTHQTFIPASPIWLWLGSIYLMVLLTRNASAKAWKRCKQSVKRMTRAKIEALPKPLYAAAFLAEVWIFYDYIEDPHFSEKSGRVLRSVVDHLQQHAAT